MVVVVVVAVVLLATVSFVGRTSHKKFSDGNAIPKDAIPKVSSEKEAAKASGSAPAAKSSPNNKAANSLPLSLLTLSFMDITSAVRTSSR